MKPDYGRNRWNLVDWAGVQTRFPAARGGLVRRLEFGIGAGSRPSHLVARREYEAHGLLFHDAAYAVGCLAEACTISGELWTSNQPFDHHGSYHDLVGRSATPSRSSAPTRRS